MSELVFEKGGARHIICCPPITTDSVPCKTPFACAMVQGCIKAIREDAALKEGR